jgi:hypothetical protein
MSGEIEAGAYPWTRVYSRDYTEVIWDSRKDEGTAELFVIRSGENWLPAVRDFSPKDRWAGRLEVTRDGDITAVSAAQEIEFLNRILVWPNPAFTESGYQA